MQAAAHFLMDAVNHRKKQHRCVGHQCYREGAKSLKSDELTDISAPRAESDKVSKKKHHLCTELQLNI